MLIRKAEPRDCAQMMDLVRELAEYERAPEAVTVTDDHFRESGFGPDPVWWAFVAEDGDRLVGFALYYIRYSTWKGQRMYLEDIIVTESYRRRGIGHRLMDALIDDGRRRGLCGMTWQVLDWNGPAIRFYEQYQASFDPAWINVMLELPSGK